jgi:hypothetical protein
MARYLKLGLIALVIILAAAIAWRSFFYTAPEASRVTSSVQPIASAPVIPAHRPLTESDLILDLFNPTQELAAAQRNETVLKQQVEEALTINFILRRCEYIDAQEYQDTYRAMLSYVQQIGLADDVVDATRILEALSSAASASYALMYGHTDCASPALQQAAQQLKQWRAAMLTTP